jgi:hypothetical protein
LYITSGVDGIGKHSKDNIDCEFTDIGFVFRILSFNGKNYRLKISPLYDLIDPADSKFKVKSKSITIDQVKRKKKHWPDIKQTKSLTKEADEIGKKKNPSAGLMGMMKEFYETGDENIKRTIAESWQKASENKMMGTQPPTCKLSSASAWATCLVSVPSRTSWAPNNRLSPPTSSPRGATPSHDWLVTLTAQLWHHVTSIGLLHLIDLRHFTCGMRHFEGVLLACLCPRLFSTSPSNLCPAGSSRPSPSTAGRSATIFLAKATQTGSRSTRATVCPRTACPCSLKKTWEKIRTQKELNLPNHRVLVGERCCQWWSYLLVLFESRFATPASKILSGGDP